MADKLVIVESPAKAKTIGKFLGKGYKVEASNGHVRDLPKSQLGVDIENDFAPKYITIRGRGDIVERIRKEAKNAKKVYLATDPDREGEAISWHLAHILKLDEKQASRIVFNEITKQAVTQSIKNARPIDMALVDAQQARRVFDRLVGYQISPLLWAKVRKGLSAGRVQSVALRILCDREDEIEAFVPQEYWLIGAKLYKEQGKETKNTLIPARYFGADGQKAEIVDGASAQRVLDEVEKEKFVVNTIKKGQRRRMPPAPFTTSGLQQEAARKLGFTTKRTMLVAQQLYEGIELKQGGTMGLVTYIRTDSVRVAKEAQEAAREYIAQTYGRSALPETPNEHKGRGRNAQDAHEAIRPTDVNLRPDDLKDSLTREQFRLYKLVYERFLASQMIPAVYETLQVTILAGRHEFRANGSRLLEAGYTRVYTESADEDAKNSNGFSDKDINLPLMQEGETLRLAHLDKEQHFTQPPPRYSEASLVRALEEKGIGRPSTYAPIISTILDRGYVRREEKLLKPTELGDIVINLLKEYFSTIFEVEFTAELEKQLDEVEDGHIQWRAVVAKFYEPFAKMLAHAEETMEKVEVKDEQTDIPCDKCGAMMVIKMGRFGKFLACPNFPACRNARPIEQKLDVPCPKCGAALLVRRTRKGRTFYGCEKYPECDFVSWDMPVKTPCPQCGSLMVKKSSRKGVDTLLCTNDACKHRVELESAADA